MAVIISTGDIRQNYEIIDTILLWILIKRGFYRQQIQTRRLKG